MDGLKIGLDLAEEMVSELEARLIEITRKKRKSVGKVNRVSVTMDNIKPSNTCNWSSERRRELLRRKGFEKMVKSFPKWVKNINLKIQDPSNLRKNKFKGNHT